MLYVAQQLPVQTIHFFFTFFEKNSAQVHNMMINIDGLGFVYN